MKPYEVNAYTTKELFLNHRLPEALNLRDWGGVSQLGWLQLKVSVYNLYQTIIYIKTEFDLQFYLAENYVSFEVEQRFKTPAILIEEWPQEIRKQIKRRRASEKLEYILE